MTVTSRRLRPLFAGAVLAVSTLAVVGCSAQSGSSSVDDATASASAASPTAAAAKALPDAVPLVGNAELVEAVKPFSGDKATGWTAVALTPSGTTLTTTATEVNQSLAQVGWVSKVTGTETEGFVIAGTRTSGATQQWLNVNVTTPVPGSGPAVTYRYASGPNPTRSASATVTR